METLYIVIKNKTRICLWLDHELLIAKFRLKLKKLGKTAKKKKKKKKSRLPWWLRW